MELAETDLLLLVPYMGCDPGQVGEYWAAKQTKMKMAERRETRTKVHEWQRRGSDAAT